MADGIGFPVGTSVTLPTSLRPWVLAQPAASPRPQWKYLGPKRISFLGGLLVLAASSLGAQSGPSFSFDPDDQAYTASGLDSVNPFTGQLALTVPIGPLYQVGPGLSFQVQLRYSSRIWSPGRWALWSCDPGPCVAEPFMVLLGDPVLGLGWRFSLGQIVESAPGIPAAYIAPDGSAHRFYNKRFFGGTIDGFFYTRDGSYLRAKYLNATSGYQMWSPNGNLTTFGKHVGPPDTVSFDDPPAAYENDYGRGRNGWHATSIANPYADAITITYQVSFPWVPYQITIPSIGGAVPRVITVNMAGSLIGSFSMPTFGGAAATYSLFHAQLGSLTRPISHPSTNPSPYFLTQIALPISGYTYSFTYALAVGSPFARGALASQTTPTGATISYDYGTWTFYHANPLNRPSTCGFPPPSPTGPTLKTGPDGLEPFLPPVGDCGSPDRSAGVVKRTVGYTTLAGPETAVTKYYQWSFPHGELGGGGPAAPAQTQTLALSPPDIAGAQQSTTYLFSASTDKFVSGPFVGSPLRQAVYSGDQSVWSDGPNTSSALRVQRFTYDGDAYDTNPINPSAESFEANRRLLQSVAIFNGVAPSSPPSGKYNTIDYQFDSNAGQYRKETHSGNLGGDARETETVWSPLVDATRWKLDLPQNLYLRAAAGGLNFSTVTDSFDTQGYAISAMITDGSGYGTLVHGTPRDSHGFPSSQSFTHGSSTYSRTLTFAAGSLKTSQWSGITWLSVNNQIDSSTGLVSMATDPAGLSTTFTYDLLSRPLVTTPPGGDAPTTITYDSPTQATAQTFLTPTEYAWSRTITDSLGRPTKIQRKMPGGAIAKKITGYDRQGNMIFESEWISDGVLDGLAPGTSFSSFDDFGRPRQITKPDGKTSSIDYSDTISNPNSVWLRTVTINDISGSPSTTKYISDAFGDLVKVIEPTLEETTYTYNPQDRLTSVTQGGQTRSFAYDAFGFLREERFPEKQNQPVTYSTYDGLGNLVSETQPGALQISRTYDSAGRLTGVLANFVRYLTNCYDGQGACVDGNPNFPGGNYPAGKLTRRIGFNPGSTPVASFTEDFGYSDRAGRLSSQTTAVSTGAIVPQTESWIYDAAGSIAQYSHPRSAGLFSVAITYDHAYPMGVRANGLPVRVPGNRPVPQRRSAGRNSRSIPQRRAPGRNSRESAVMESLFVRIWEPAELDRSLWTSGRGARERIYGGRPQDRPAH